MGSGLLKAASQPSLNLGGENIKEGDIGNIYCLSLGKVSLLQQIWCCMVRYRKSSCWSLTFLKEVGFQFLTQYLLLDF